MRFKSPHKQRLLMIVLAALMLPGKTPLYAQADPTTEPLLQLTDLVYQGSFQAPAGVAPANGEGLDYGGHALAFNPNGPNGGSLYIVGHNWYQFSAEISIPATLSKDINTLPSSTFIQPLTDALEGHINDVGNIGTKAIGGQLVYNGKLYITDYGIYDGDGSQVLSHFVRPLDLSVKGQLQGPFQIGPLGAGFYDGYFGSIPSEWQTALGGPVLNGNCCLNIISRTSYGPAAFAMNPENISVVEDNAHVVPLVYYPSTHPQSTFDVESTQVWGVAFPQGARSVLFFGKQGVGPKCYGIGTSDPTDASECYDPDNSSKGGHSYPYLPIIWAYDANDLAAVKAGTKNPWTEVQPQGMWQFPLPFGGHNLVGATYDPVTNRLFICEGGAAALPIIHVYTVNKNTPSDTLPPSPPTGLVATPVSSSQINLTWTASTDNFGVAGYTIYRDGVQINASLATSFPSAGLSPATSYTYAVVAFDYSGNLSAQSASVTVKTGDASAPSVAITAPANNATVSGTVQVIGTASDTGGIEGVQFQMDGANAGTQVLTAPYTYSLDTTHFTDGSHTLTAIAQNVAGQTASVTITLTIHNAVPTLPMVAITAPANNATVSGTVQVIGTASDTGGIGGVQFQMDGANVGTKVLSAPYTYSLDTTHFTDGPHTLTAVAQNVGGQTASAAITVTIHNAASTNPVPGVLTFQLPPFLTVNAQINATYTGPSAATDYLWLFTPTAEPSVSGSSSANSRAAAQTPAASMTTLSPQANLAVAHLILGSYVIRVQAVDVNGAVLAQAQANVTLVPSDLSAVRIYPNPWRSDKHSAHAFVTFDGLTFNTKIKIFTVSGHWVKTLPLSNASVTWDLADDAGDKVASGIYLYVITTDQGQKKTGQMVVIR